MTVAELSLRKPSPDEVLLALTGHTTPTATVRNGLQPAWRSALKLKTNPGEVIGPLLRPVMFVALFVFGQALMGGWQAYRDFLMPGTVAQSVIFATPGTGFTLSQAWGRGSSTGSVPCPSQGPPL